MKFSLTILLGGCLAAVAQPPMASTNVLSVHPSFRIVNGQLYNTDKSILFSNLAGQCVAVLSNGVVIQQLAIRRSYTNVNVDPPQLANALGFQPTKRLISEEIVPGKKLFIRNYPAPPSAKVGATIAARAMRDGTFNYESETLELWDHGAPGQVPSATNAPKSAVPKP